jgi:hypothetical protein
MRLSSMAALAFLAANAMGCDPDTAVFVDASVSGVVLSAEQSSLSTGVGGFFVLSLHLGDRASDASEVGLGAFSITDASRSETLVPSLEFTSDPSFPVTVDVDSTVEIQATLAPEDNLVEADLLDALCAPGGVVVVGALDDPLAGGTIDVASAATPVTGCP